MSDYEEAYKKSVQILQLSRKSGLDAFIDIAETLNITLSLNNVLYSETALKQLDVLVLRAAAIENALPEDVRSSVTDMRYTALSMITHIQAYTKKESPMLYKQIEQRLTPKIKP